MEMVSNVYIIFNKLEMTESDVRNILEDEGYKHNFHFGDIQGNSKSISALEHCDEVWTFKDCRNIPDYIKAVELNLDIWRMG